MLKFKRSPKTLVAALAALVPSLAVAQTPPEPKTLPKAGVLSVPGKGEGLSKMRRPKSPFVPVAGAGATGAPAGTPAGAPAGAEPEEIIAAPGEGGPGGAVTEKGPPCKPTRGKVQFEFKNAELKDAVTLIAKLMCRNFILSSKIRGQKFDVISPTPITVDEAWRAFLSTLEASDLTIYQVGRYYKIIQATDGTRSPLPFHNPEQAYPNHDGMLTKVWKVRYGGDLNAIVNYLNIFKSAKGQIHPFVATNTMVATDFGSSLERLELILNEIDQKGVLERVHVVPVEFATASELAQKLTEIFEPQKGGGPKPPGGTPKRLALKPEAQTSGEGAAGVAGGEGGALAEGEGPAYSLSKIIPDDRTNKLIVISSEPTFKQIMALKRHLDTPTEGGEGLVQVVKLRHANAEELASTLSSLATGGKKPTTPRPATAPNAPKAPGAQAVLFEGDLKITSDKPTNSLVVTASKSDFTSLKRVIEKLDVPRLQVFVEAVIMEVAVKRDRNLGVTWHGGVNTTVDDQNIPILFGNSHRDFSSLALSTNPLGLVSLLGFATAVRGPPLEGTESLIQGGIPAIGVVLQALKSSNDVNIISTPHLLTMDNQEAEIKVSEKRPFPSGVTLGGLGGALAGIAGGASGQAGLPNLSGLGLGSVSFSREDVGLSLKLKPTINDQQTVRLELDQELSDVAGTDAVTGQTITSKRAAKTTVVVRDQESVVIGGLVRDRESTDESKVPLLGDIPILGWLFKRQQKVVEKVNLVLVLTPYIIRSADDFRRIYERKMEERRQFVDLFYGTTPEYRASVDWTRKLGPLARYRQLIREERQKAENEGPGLEGEEVIRPEDGIPLETRPEIVPPGAPGETPPIDPTPPAGEE